ncbi:conserved hypothetical protein [Gloeothece citriformis PCC 7424]|uniref:Glycosyltransferase RgtA/B/C/D-like domain-containing protein n=1 Tax=Gloeothece citriformis (strain PCC 7424) TaxID=65393 RepID=B7K805_GLOC7|nr:hypothetical protein [Gloeothece citriformis]ACK68493.1 conserved hypothetical protein [Gloeothece citriformis PCC 7424]
MKTLNFKTIPTPVLLALGYFLLGGVLCVILGQDISWDLRNYHFYNPYMFLTGRMKYDILPSQIQTFFSPFMDIPFFVAIYYLKIPPIIVGFVSGGIHGLNLWFVHYILYFSLINVTYKYKHLLSFLAALTSSWGAGYISVLGTTIGDSTNSLFVLGSLLIIIYNLSKNSSLKLKDIALAGLVMGLGVGLKFTVAIYGIGLMVAINFLKNSGKEKFWNLLVLGSSMFSGFLISVGYWMYLMWTNFSNPLFPFFNKIFQSPYIETESNLKDLRFLPRNIWQSLFYPFHFWQDPPLVAEVPFREFRFAIAYLLIVGLIAVCLYKLFSRQKLQPETEIINPDSFSIMIPFYTASYLIWQTQFSIYRYLISIELLTPVLIVLIIGYVYPFKKQLMFISIAIFVFIIATVKPLDWWRMGWDSNYFGIDSNSLTRYENSTIVMWGDEPTSYLVPHFPQTTRFVRIKGNAGLSENTLMRKNAENYLNNAPSESLYFLERDKQDRTDEKAQDLADFNLTLDSNNCSQLLTRIEGENYYLCSLKKLN